MKNILGFLVVLIMLIALYASPVQAAGSSVGQNATASWGAVTTNDDGTASGPVTYTAYVGTTQGVYPYIKAGITTTTVPISTVVPLVALLIPYGQYYIVVTAVRVSDGRESLNSTEVPFVVINPSRPGAPKNLIIQTPIGGLSKLVK